MATRQRKIMLVPLFAFIGVFALLTMSDASANPPPLPSLPSTSVINSVLAATNGAITSTMGIPNYVINQLVPFGGVFDGIENNLNTAQAVTYFGTTGRLFEGVYPVNGLRTTEIAPDITTPGSKPKPGKILGAVFMPSDGGVRIVVAVFKNWSSDEPDKVRFYSTNTAYTEQKFKWNEFEDANGDDLVEPVDDGAVISHDLSCITFGLGQQCWEPYNYSTVRQEPLPKDLIYDAYTEFKDLYDLSVDFYVDDAVPDLFGVDDRADCAAQLLTATSFSALSDCTANLIVSASKKVEPNQPIAIFVVRATVDIRTYDRFGTFIGDLPAGEYLVMDATPSVTTPGSAALLYLVNADGVNHYLIPATVLQGFGTGSGSDARQAGIKDGFAGYRSWGG